MMHKEIAINFEDNLDYDNALRIAKAIDSIRGVKSTEIDWHYFDGDSKWRRGKWPGSVEADGKRECWRIVDIYLQRAKDANADEPDWSDYYGNFGDNDDGYEYFKARIQTAIDHLWP